jgi:hypothetical protein
MEKCKKHWYVKALVELENGSNMYLIFRNGSVMKISSMLSIREDNDWIDWLLLLA